MDQKKHSIRNGVSSIICGAFIGGGILALANYSDYISRETLLLAGIFFLISLFDGLRHFLPESKYYPVFSPILIIASVFALKIIVKPSLSFGGIFGFCILVFLGREVYGYIKFLMRSENRIKFAKAGIVVVFLSVLAFSFAYIYLPRLSYTIISSMDPNFPPESKCEFDERNEKCGIKVWGQGNVVEFIDNRMSLCRHLNREMQLDGNLIRIKRIVGGARGAPIGTVQVKGKVKNLKPGDYILEFASEDTYYKTVDISDKYSFRVSKDLNEKIEFQKESF